MSIVTMDVGSTMKCPHCGKFMIKISDWMLRLFYFKILFIVLDNLKFAYFYSQDKILWFQRVCHETSNWNYRQYWSDLWNSNA
jgi:type II secretory pathway component PulF